MPPKVSAPKMMRRAGDLRQNQTEAEYDLERTKYLQSLGYRVLRFWNNELLNNMDGVLRRIWEEANKVP
jgi:very-short-patch-repair endonuclease